MWRTAKQGIFALAFFALLLSVTTTPPAQVRVASRRDSPPDGATYLIEVPSNWNGTLFLYSHGYVVPGEPNPAQDVGDPATGAFLLANGFALPRCAYVHTWG